MLHFLSFATALAAIAAAYDVRTGHIPNRLTLGGLLAATVGHFIHGTVCSGVGAGAEEAGLALLGALGCAAVPLLMFRKGVMGGGDVKLLAALGAALHPLAGLEAETYGFVAAALLAPAKLAWDGRLLVTLKSTLSLLLNPLRQRAERRALPDAAVTWFRLGPAIFLGTAATLLVRVLSDGVTR